MNEPAPVDSVWVLDTFLPNVRIDSVTKAELERLAREAERTLAGEIRLALRRHVERKANP